MKKAPVVFGLLAVFLMTVLIAGCGEKAKETAAPGKQETKAPAESSKTDEPSTADLLGKGKAIIELSYEYEAQMPDSEKIAAKTWIKGKKMRTEMNNPAEGGNIITIIDSEKGVAYVYQPAQKMATKMDISMAQQEDSASPTETLESYKPDSMNLVGRETVDGKKCLVYEFKDENQTKAWLWEENGLPIKTEVMMDGKKAVGLFKNLKIGNIADSMFTLPEGTQIMELSLPKQ
ncbi:MAG: DUF4412 domain-containing protein [Syntrophomonas sp.]